MGLSVGVGMLEDLNANDAEGAEWFREAMAGVNAVLRENGLPDHVEPEALPPLRNRAELQSYPHSFLHYLRRFAAHAAGEPGWEAVPFAESSDPTDDPAVANAHATATSHLICHDDCEGYYVPVEFHAPLFSDGQAHLTCGMIGSSYSLMRELVGLAAFLGISVPGGHLSDAEAERVNRTVRQRGAFWVESAVWLSLFEAARLSIEHRTAICFG